MASQDTNLAYRRPEAVPPTSVDQVVRDGAVVALDLDRSLPGVPGEVGRYRFPLPDPVQRVRVLATPDGRGTLVVSGGMRNPLSYHLIADGTRQLSIRFSAGRLRAGTADPILDDRGAVLAFLFEQSARLELRVVDTTGSRPQILLASAIDSPPTVFELRASPGDAWTGIHLGKVKVRPPGQDDFVPAGDPALGFLHPAATLPRPSVLRLEFGTVPDTGHSGRAVIFDNPGPLPLRLLLRAADLGAWQVRLHPDALTLRAGGRAECLVSLPTAPKGAPLFGRLEVVGGAGAGDVLTEIFLQAKAVQVVDEDPPVLTPRLIEHHLLAGRRARLRGLAGAVHDVSPPCTVGDPSGALATVAGDGSFEIEVPVPLDRRLLLWTQDSLGKRSRAWFLGELLDRRPPVVAADLVRIDLPEHGWTRVRGAAGSVLDETTPVQVELAVDGRPHEAPIAVTPDGSFATRVRAGPGATLTLIALDGSAPLNRSQPVALGRVLPYIERVGEELVLFGPPAAAFDLLPGVAAADGSPATSLRRLRGRLDGRGQARLPPDKIAGATVLRFEIERPDGVGRLTSSYEPR